jgi:hypothetical protein
LYGAQYACNLKIASNISRSVELLQGFFPLNLKSFELLYRASEHNFDIKKFHEKCDSVPNTLVLIETEFGRVLGGYTPIPWTSKDTL